MKNQIISRILIFYAISITLSNLFRFDVFNLNDKIAELPTAASILLRVFLEGIGVFLGALIAIRLLKKVKTTTMSLFGTSKTKSIMLFSLPIIVLSILGIRNTFNVDSNLYGFIAGIGTFIYCILEEYGWRGYLQDELTELKSWRRYLIIGFLWYVWHLPFLTNPGITGNLIFFGMLVLGSWGIGQIAIATKSIIACASFHFLVNIFTVNQLIKYGFDGNPKWIAISIILIPSIIIVSKWEKVEKINFGKKELN